jgi:hypothetical protein
MFAELGVFQNCYFNLLLLSRTFFTLLCYPAFRKNLLERDKKGRGSNLCAALNAAYLAGESPVPGIAYLPG